MKLETRFKLAGVESLAVGALLLLSFLSKMLGPSVGGWLPSVDSDLPIIGGVLIYVGLETLSLRKHIRAPNKPARTRDDSRDQATVRRLVELDLALHGRRFILAEFGITAPAMIVGGFLISILSYWPLGAYISLVGVNYAVLMIYAVILTRQNAIPTKQDRAVLREQARRFGILQLLILVPLSILLMEVLNRSGTGFRRRND